MTTLEHVMLGASAAIACGLHRRGGWQLPAMAGLVAAAPDWDALTVFWSVGLFDQAHRAWGHGLLPCLILAVILALVDYRLDLVTRVARVFAKRTRLVAPEVALARRTTFTLRGASLWIAFASLAAISHPLADMMVSGGAGLSDWEIRWLWPLSDRGDVYPLVPWGDPGLTIIFSLGAFAMVRWSRCVQLIAIMTLLGIAVYAFVRGMMR